MPEGDNRFRDGTELSLIATKLIINNTNAEKYLLNVFIVDKYKASVVR